MVQLWINYAEMEICSDNFKCMESYVYQMDFHDRLILLQLKLSMNCSLYI
jgi:hypothetical protein